MQETKIIEDLEADLSRVSEDSCFEDQSSSAPLPLRRACMVAYTFYESDNRVRRYAETLAKLGCEVDVIALRKQGQTNTVEWINGVRVLRIQRRVVNEKRRWQHLVRLLFFLVRSTWVLTREQLARGYQLIHVHSIPDFEIFAAWMPKLAGAKLILDIHDIVPEYYAAKFKVGQAGLVFRLLVAIERISAAFCDHVIAANHLWQTRLAKRSVPETKVTTLLNYPDERIFHRQGRRRSGEKIVLLYPGSLNYHQGLDLAIRAFALVRDQVPEAEFHIYGVGQQLPYLRSLIQELGLSRQVIYAGERPLEEIASIIERADIGLVPKRKDGFGNEAFSTKILEFMSMEVPVIVPDTAIDKYYFNDSVVEFFQAGNEHSLAEKMLYLIKNSDRRKALAKNASYFVKDFLWEKNQDVYLRILKALFPGLVLGPSASEPLAKSDSRC